MTALHPVLGQLALGYCPMVGRDGGVVATRLSVFPASPNAVPDPGALLAALQQVWPAPDGASAAAEPVPRRPLDRPTTAPDNGLARAPVVLSIAGEAALEAMMRAVPGPQVMLEIPAFMATDLARHDALRALRDAGTALLIKGRPLQPLTAEVLAFFSHSIVDVEEDRRTDTPPAPGVRQVTTVQSGVRTSADVDRAFRRGAVAVLGWTLDDPLPAPAARQDVPSDVSAVLDLIAGIDRGDSPGRMEAVLRRDPTLAYRLLRYLNSPAFGLSAEITSFAQALMMLGEQRLKRWLLLMLAKSARDRHAGAMVYGAVRRGLVMEEIGRALDDDDAPGEMFFCGVFSLLDRLLQQPLSTLLAGVPVPERVRLALEGETGPYHAYLELVRAIENGAAFDIREGTERLLLTPAEVNRALLAALGAARDIG